LDDWLRSVPLVREHEPLRAHSWYGIGGTARWFLEVTDDRQLSGLARRAYEAGTPLWPLGAGSNTLFTAPELPGLTLQMATDGIDIADATVRVDAGYLMPRLAAETAKAGRGGLEFGAGVPGTVGGSVFGNAGAFGREVKDALLEAEVIDPEGGRRWLPADECGFAYRESVFKAQRRGWIITAARFGVQPDDPRAIRQRILEVQKHRRQTQPVEQRSLGSTFKNPPGDAAGRLVDAAGLKGTRIGGAQVSPKHANFIVNVDHARAEDVLALMREMRHRVRDRFGIVLEPEVQFLPPGAGL
jgi:UDP-N-acetylmuramate dehydrogenase